MREPLRKKERCGMHTIHENNDLRTIASTHMCVGSCVEYVRWAHNRLITSTHACIGSCVDRPYLKRGARIRSYFCSSSVNMLTEHKASVGSIKWNEPARKIRAAREYMRAFIRQRINACIAFPLSVSSACLPKPRRWQVVNNHSCGFVSIRGSKGL